MKQYIMPQTQAQTITIGQLMAGSPNGMGVNYKPISGSDSEGIIYGD